LKKGGGVPFFFPTFLTPHACLFQGTQQKKGVAFLAGLKNKQPPDQGLSKKQNLGPSVSCGFCFVVKGCSAFPARLGGSWCPFFDFSGWIQTLLFSRFNQCCTQKTPPPPTAGIFFPLFPGPGRLSCWVFLSFFGPGAPLSLGEKTPLPPCFFLTPPPNKPPPFFFLGFTTSPKWVPGGAFGTVGGVFPIFQWGGGPPELSCNKTFLRLLNQGGFLGGVDFVFFFFKKLNPFRLVLFGL